MTAVAPAASAMRACSASTTSMMTPPLSISARPDFVIGPFFMELSFSRHAGALAINRHVRRRVAATARRKRTGRTSGRKRARYPVAPGETNGATAPLRGSAFLGARAESVFTALPRRRAPSATRSGDSAQNASRTPGLGLKVGAPHGAGADENPLLQRLLVERVDVERRRKRHPKDEAVARRSYACTRRAGCLVSAAASASRRARYSRTTFVMCARR